MQLAILEKTATRPGVDVRTIPVGIHRRDLGSIWGFLGTLQCTHDRTARDHAAPRHAISINDTNGHRTPDWFGDVIRAVRWPKLLSFYRRGRIL